jgi:hypothetical protein
MAISMVCVEQLFGNHLGQHRRDDFIPLPVTPNSSLVNPGSLP